MKIKLSSIIIFLILILMSFNVFATGNYIKDEASVLSSGTVDKVNSNFTKLEKNTGSQVRIYLIKSLNGKNINDLAMSKAKSDTSTDKYAIFVVAIKDHKSKFISGPGLNAVFNNSELDRMASLPNSDFKNSDFNTGILKVGQAIDQDITSKAIQSGKAVVKTDGYSTSVEPKKSHAGLIIFIILLIAAILVFIYYKKKKDEKATREFARRNGLNYKEDKSNKGFKSASMSEEGTELKKSNSYEEKYSDRSTRPRHVTQEVHAKTIINSSITQSIHSSPRPTEMHHHNHTTGIHENNNNDFVNGVILGEMMANNNDHHNCHHEESVHDDYTPSYNSNNNDSFSSGDWGSSSGSSDWGSSSDSGSSDW